MNCCCDSTRDRKTSKRVKKTYNARTTFRCLTHPPTGVVLPQRASRLPILNPSMTRVKKTRVKKVREIFAWILPSAILVLVPKCPVCLVAYVTLWTGLGLSFSTATYLRDGLLFVCVAALLFLVVERLKRSAALFNHFRKETRSCNTQ